jgi:hypothetical protein
LCVASPLKGELAERVVQERILLLGVWGCPLTLLSPNVWGTNRGFGKQF